MIGLGKKFIDPGTIGRYSWGPRGGYEIGGIVRQVLKLTFFGDIHEPDSHWL